MLLERRGDGPARLLGVGESSDAHHMSHPHPEGVGAIAAMTEALAQARIEGSAVDYVNAHGTATPANDVVEARAIERVIGNRAAVASTKGFTGHMLGAAGMTEAVFAVMAMERSFVPESLGAAPLDPGVRLDIVRSARRMRVRHAVSNSFAFGGSNASVVFGAA
jgi:3-oxoacyl-[acyl-carrier-protein] synthase-1